MSKNPWNAAHKTHVAQLMLDFLHLLLQGCDFRLNILALAANWSPSI
jgi:hypothetical protein